MYLEIFSLTLNSDSGAATIWAAESEKEKWLPLLSPFRQTLATLTPSSIFCGEFLSKSSYPCAMTGHSGSRLTGERHREGFRPEYHLQGKGRAVTISTHPFTKPPSSYMFQGPNQNTQSLFLNFTRPADPRRFQEFVRRHEFRDTRDLDLRILPSAISRSNLGSGWSEVRTSNSRMSKAAKRNLQHSVSSYSGTSPSRAKASKRLWSATFEVPTCICLTDAQFMSAMPQKHQVEKG